MVGTDRDDTRLPYVAIRVGRNLTHDQVWRTWVALLLEAIEHVAENRCGYARFGYNFDGLKHRERAKVVEPCGVVKVFVRHEHRVDGRQSVGIAGRFVEASSFGLLVGHLFDLSMMVGKGGVSARGMVAKKSEHLHAEVGAAVEE